ncbi:MAG: NuoI/complex I 23 kDa subunit family protein [Nitrospinota bacterium]
MESTAPPCLTQYFYYRSSSRLAMGHHAEPTETEEVKEQYNPKYRVGQIPDSHLKAKLVRENINLTFWEWLYLPEIIHGLWVTSTHFFKNMFGFVSPPKGKKRLIPTIYYPEEKPEIPDAYRGRPTLVAFDNGNEKCVACGLCEKICPADAIFILGAERGDEAERYPKTWDLDLSRCIFCGFCEEVCPKEAIVMSDIYEDLATYSRKDMVVPKEKLMVKEKDLQAKLAYVRRIYDKCNY